MPSYASNYDGYISQSLYRLTSMEELLPPEVAPLLQTSQQQGLELRKVVQRTVKLFFSNFWVQIPILDSLIGTNTMRVARDYDFFAKITALLL